MYNLMSARRRKYKTRAVPMDVATVEQALRQISLSLPALSEFQSHVMTGLYTLADAGTAQIMQSVTDAAQMATDAATSDTVKEVATQAASTAANKTGPFTFIADGLESILKVIDSGLETVHVPYAYGFSIILLTVFVKILTFPLSKKQVESSIAMQQLQPQIKKIQEENKNNPQLTQQLTAQLYQSAGVNPLAGNLNMYVCAFMQSLGCLPTLATIPVFIGLYRALLNAADEGILKEGFFVIPSLAGPTTISARAAGMGTSWLFPFKDGAPPIGWYDAAAYLVLPTLLVISQYISQSILQSTRSTDPSQNSAQTFLKVLPLLLGWFSLNVPSGLALYWITNNVLTTGQQVFLKRQMQTPEAATSTSTMPPRMGDVIDTVATESSPSEEKQSGKELGSRRSKKERPEPVVASPSNVTETVSKPRKKKGERFRARKARETAKKAQSQSSRLRPKKQPKTPFIQEQPIEAVVSEFEKELAASPLLPLEDQPSEAITGSVSAEATTEVQTTTEKPTTAMDIEGTSEIDPTETPSVKSMES